MSLGVCFKKRAPHHSWCVCLISLQCQNWRFFRCPVWKTKSWQKYQTYMKTETCRLYFGVFWIFLPNVIEIDPYNFELYLFKVGAYLRHSVVAYRRHQWHNGWHDTYTTSKQRLRSFILVPIDFSYATVNRNFYCRTHCLPTIHNVTDDGDRQTQHCSISATVSTFG